MTKVTFETIVQAQRMAKKRLPKSVYISLVAGSEQGLTLDENVAAFSELTFAPLAAGLAPRGDLSTRVMGQELSLPVIIAPTGVQAIVPDGEIAVARAAASRGTAIAIAISPASRWSLWSRPTPRRSPSSIGWETGTR